MGYENLIVCPECYVAVLEPHWKLRGWAKCRVCGFCLKIDTDLDKQAGA